MNGQIQFNRGLNEARLPRSALAVRLVAVVFLCFLGWAYFFKLDEVTTGTGTVEPSGRDQVVQSLEGGILYHLNVKVGDIVEQGQPLAQLNRTKTESDVQEAQSRLYAALATSARLNAEVNNTSLVFPDELKSQPELIASETALYTTRREALTRSISGLEEGIRLVNRELGMTQPLVKQGAASSVEVLRLQRQLNEMQNKITEIRTQYYVRAREDLAKANADAQAQRSVIRGREDSLTRLNFTAPVRGIVKDIDVTTVGGVIAPGGKLMTIVPLDEQLLIEAKISPRDVAFIHPGQASLVKITAYDYSIFGALAGEVAVISPDTLQDEVRRDVYYYRVYIRTDSNHLQNRAGQSFPIFPGMVATVDIKTGRKTVLDYLLKPFNKAREALRER
ncbi:HlyD family type I secretion periplasmic adaptor subunit [Pseudocitrobacter sp. RIT415]|uniref:HlyD family type I secretion periplasmic adaptor subunit n=1 Tax=Pseudocitrobacter sp. RIT415 TaxID=2202163 RepID=UPI000D3600FD|nr:HlyD family type I secretion periplasmic adaptor subunit [Pseudocitrobacter sp. RIT 415]RAU52184.1 HlyD family type I secretion periplasmic adaptor subunit [Pseudocitrobacter sp. RIT 415]